MSKHARFLPIFLLIILAFIWGSSFILMKNGLKVYSAEQVATMRMSFSFVCLLPLTLKHARKVPKNLYLMVLLVGLLGNGLPSILFAVAQTHLNSSTAGVLNSLTPIFTLLVAALFFKQRFSKKQIIGVLLGLLGAICLILVRANGTIETNYVYGFYILLATICYAWSVNLIKNYLSEIPAIAISSMVLIVIGPLYGYDLINHTDFLSKLSNNPESLKALGYIFLLSFFGTAISLILYNKLVQITDPLYASSVTYLIPIIAFMWGILDGEPINLIHLISMSIILVGVYLANRKPKTV